MTKTITIEEYRRRDGTVVPEHERVIENAGDNNLTRGVAVGVGLALGAAAFVALRKFDSPLLGHFAGGWSDLERTLSKTPIKDLVSKSVYDTLPLNVASGALKKLDSLDAPITTQKMRAGSMTFRVIDQPDYGFFTRKAYKPLEGKSVEETLRNIERFIKGKKVEHNFFIDSRGGIKAAYRGDGHAAPAILPSSLSWRVKQSMTFTHNHPRQVPYSGGDLTFQATEGIGVGRAVLPDGTVSQMTITGNKIRAQSLRNTNELNRVVAQQVEVMEDVGGWKMSELFPEQIPPDVFEKIVTSDRYYKTVVDGYRALQARSRGAYKYDEYASFVKRGNVKVVADISKVDDEKRQVFGWASITELNGDPVIDLQSDYIETVELEKAAYSYVMNSRVGGEMHQRVEKSKPKKVADLIESMVLTDEKIEKMGLPQETPRGWWIGFQIGRDEDGDKVWDAVKKGKYAGFSIHGLGKRAEKTLDDVEKATVRIEQYTRRDGTVVEAHDREIDVSSLAHGTVDAGIAGATGYIASRYHKSGKRGLAAAYGAYALLSLLNGASNIVPEVVRQVRGVEKSAKLNEKQFDNAVKTLAGEVGAEPKEFLSRLGAFLDEDKALTEKDLVRFMETFDVVKFLTEEVV